MDACFPTLHTLKVHRADTQAMLVVTDQAFASTEWCRQRMHFFAMADLRTTEIEAASGGLVDVLFK